MTATRLVGITAVVAGTGLWLVQYLFFVSKAMILIAVLLVTVGALALVIELVAWCWSRLSLRGR